MSLLIIQINVFLWEYQKRSEDREQTLTEILTSVFSVDDISAKANSVFMSFSSKYNIVLSKPSMIA